MRDADIAAMEQELLYFDAFEEEEDTAALMVATVFNDLDESSDEEKPKWGDSKPGRAPNKKRDFIGAHNRIIEHYFNGEDSLYDEKDFERRFRVPRVIFQRIADALTGIEPFVQHYHKSTKKPLITPLCRLVGSMRMLAYGNPADQNDE